MLIPPGPISDGDDLYEQPDPGVVEPGARHAITFVGCRLARNVKT
jgi:hypothetical protein